MSGLSTAEIVADLRDFVSCLSPSRPTDHIREAADRLTELEAEKALTARQVDALFAKLRAIDALRPPCPTCGGKGFVDDDLVDGQSCPDCVDGKVTVERMGALWDAVHDPHLHIDYRSYMTVLDHLRAVRP